MRTATRTFVRDQGSNAAVGRQSCELRTAPGLTQRQLADLVGTKQPVIPRLEDTDCEGHGAPGVRERRIWPARRRSNGTTRGPPRRRPWESAMSNPTAGYRAGPVPVRARSCSAARRASVGVTKYEMTTSASMTPMSTSFSARVSRGTPALFPRLRTVGARGVATRPTRPAAVTVRSGRR